MAQQAKGVVGVEGLAGSETKSGPEPVRGALDAY